MGRVVKASHPKDEAGQRLVNRGYSDAELDHALLRSQRSDPVTLAIKLVSLSLVYYLLARAIHAGMPSPYLLLPLLVELVLVLWLGWLMARTVVRCPAFRRSGTGLLGTVIWSVLILLPAIAWLGFDTQAGNFSLTRIPLHASEAGARSLEFDLHWSIVAMAAGLALSTAREVLAWRGGSGVFVWTSITTAATRFGLLILLSMIIGILAVVLGRSPLRLLERWGWLDFLAQGLWAWPVWGVLLLLDIGTILVLALMHRELLRKRASTPQVRATGTLS